MLPKPSLVLNSFQSCKRLCQNRLSSSKGSQSDEWRSQSNYKWFLTIQTRWNDNDQYGHINNANYHAIYDSAINIFLIRHCGLQTGLKKSTRVGFMVTNECKFFAPAKYPLVYLAGMAVNHIGNSSIKYKVALFPPKCEDKPICGDLVRGHFSGDQILDDFSSSAICTGQYVHVFVDPKNGDKPVDIPDSWRIPLQKLRV